jgi:L-2-hydroxyglutarate oxidase LhgO
MSERIDCVVIGAGVVGLATARALAAQGREVIVLEQHDTIGEETSSRNSEVIHAGIYYPTGSLKARLCLAGKRRLYEYCATRGIGHRRCGKLIVAIDDTQMPTLRKLQSKATENGVDDLEWVDTPRLHAMEPAVRGIAALWSPSTGIVDAHGLMLALQADLEARGGTVVTSTECTGGAVEPDGIVLDVVSGDSASSVLTRTVVNAAGLHATRVARTLLGTSAGALPETRYAKGDYFAYHDSHPFEHLVYPLPVAGGLGIHATLDLAGRLRFGPDVEWVDALEYAVDPGKAVPFHAAISTYWPEASLERLAPAYAGIRPKISAPGEPAADFAIEHVRVSATSECVHLLGIESPGLTASLAIGDHVAGLLSSSSER